MINTEHFMKTTSTSFHRDKFIIPPPDQRKFTSQHSKTYYISQASFKRNILMSSTKHKSQSQQKLRKTTNTFNRNSEYSMKNDQFKQNKQPSTKQIQSQNEKFKILNKKTAYESNWLRWKKSSVQVADKTFLVNLSKKVQKKSLPFEQKDKQNTQIFQLKHGFRQLSQLKNTVKKAHENNNLIKKLKIQSNQKIQQFFGKYEKIIQQTIK